MAKTRSDFIVLLVFLVLASCVDFARAQDIVQTSKTTFLNDQAKARRVSLTVEFSGTSMDQTINEMKGAFGGTLVDKGEEGVVLAGSDLGDLQLIRSPGKLKDGVQIVTPQLTHQQVIRFDAAFEPLRKKKRIDVRVNVELARPGSQLTPEIQRIAEDIQSNYTAPAHQEQMAQALGKSKKRTVFYDNGFNIEFREPSSKLGVKDSVEWALGMTEASVEYGTFDHDALMAELSGLHPLTMEKFRENSGNTGLRIIRYDMASDPAAAEQMGFIEKNWTSVKNKFTHGSAELYSLPETAVVEPLQLSGDTVIWHRRHMHRATVLGKYNPGLVNYNLQQAMENKLFEAKVLQKYVPESVPRTDSLADIQRADATALVKAGADGKFTEEQLLKVKAALDKANPKGWVLKGSFDYNTGKTEIITDKTDFKKLAKSVNMDFQAEIARFRAEYPTLDYEHLLNVMKQKLDFKAFLLQNYLKEPELALVQQRMNLITEYRVEMVEGKILSDWAMIDRYFKDLPLKDKVVKGVRMVLGTDPDSKLIRNAVEAWFKKLPEHYRYMPYGLDVAIVEEGGKRVAKIIETNPGGNSGFLHQWRGSSQALNAYLAEYPDRAKKGQVYTGLSGEEQMKILESEFKSMGLNVETHFPGMTFEAAAIFDPAVCVRKLIQKVVR